MILFNIILNNKKHSMSTKKRPHCAGIIVFDKNRTVLVSTERGHFSFPKGKRNKDETEIDAAWRELEEETGLTKNNVELIYLDAEKMESYCLDEYSDKGNLSIRYFVGKLVNPIKKFKFDPTELANVQWYTIEDAMNLDKFKQSRKNILQEAYKNFAA